jgi:hypothetical protein
MTAKQRNNISADADQQSDAAPVTEDQKREIRALLGDRYRIRRRVPKVKLQSAPGKPLKLDYPPIEAARLMATFGTVDLGFADLMLSGLVNAAVDGSPSNPPSEGAINRVLAAATGIGARDEIEGMLATQMVATHFAAITLLRRLKGAENIPQQSSAGSLAVKLLRTYTIQVEALQRYRGKGQQRVIVEHVHIHSGAQAIVGAVTQGGGVQPKSEDQPVAPALTHEPGQTLPSEVETVGEAVPSSCG